MIGCRPYLAQTVIEASKYAAFVEHFAAETMLVVGADASS